MALQNDISMRQIHSLLVLPLEIVVSIFDCLDIRDLASLCLLSRDFQSLATPTLYDHMYFEANNFSDMTWWTCFFNAVSKIASFTRRITIFDGPPPKDAILPTNRSRQTRQNGRFHWDQVSFFICQILLYLNPDTLKGFRLFSPRPLEQKVVETLLLTQAKLVHFQATIVSDLGSFSSCAPNPSPISKLPTRLQNLRSLDIHFFDLEDLPAFFLGLVQVRHSALEELRISCWKNLVKYRRVTEIHTSHTQEPIEACIDSKLPKKLEVLANALVQAITKCGLGTERLSLKKLTLDGFNLNRVITHLSRILYLQSLSELTLWNCSHADTFLLDMCRQNHASSLQRLAVEFDEATDDQDGAVNSIIDICALTSFHMYWRGSRIAPNLTREATTRLGTTIKSLSFHDQWLQEAADARYVERYLHTSLLSCKNLQQFGIQVGNNCLDLSINEGFWGFLHRLPSLSILHLRSYEIPYHVPLLQFATNLFTFLKLKEYCPTIRAIVIGAWADPEGTNTTRRHIFLRKQSIGGSECFAVQVSGSALHGMLCSDILDYDPGCNYMGARPGQICRLTGTPRIDDFWAQHFIK